MLKRRFAAFLATLMLLAAPTFAAPPGEVAVICDQEIAPYRALLEGLKSACDCTVRVISPQEIGPEGLEVRLMAAGVRAVVAVGEQGRSAVEGLRNLPVLLTMIPQVQPWVAARANRYGVDMVRSPRLHLETLRRVFPWAKRIGLFFDPAQSGKYVLEARKEAAALGVSLVTREVMHPDELPRRLAELRQLVDVIWLQPDSTVLQADNLNVLLLASFESHIPLYGFARKYVELGAIAAVHLDPAALGEQVAGMIQRVSAIPADADGIRWEYARGAQLVLNQKVARKMGIVLDPKVLETAADVLR